ncbi:major capsid protein P2 [Marinimicrobium sp. C2-29]|uniref:major capsid protein P2 n=1 Tax=Marinimicrobium sp. C2-29 TaxID=3139825 RepID=UPI003139ADE9
MSRIREEITLIENVSPGQRALVSPMVGRTWLDFNIELTNITLAQAKNVRVLLVSPNRTITLQEFKDGEELKAFNDRYGRKTSTSNLSFYFRKPELENEGQSMATALGTGGLQALRVEFDIDGAVVSPGVSAWGRKTANRPVSAGILPYVVNHNVGGQAEGENHYDAIEKRDRIAAIHVLNAAVDHLKLKVDDAVVFDLNRARATWDVEVAGRTQYAAAEGLYIDFTTAGVLDEALVMQASGGRQIQQMRLSATMGATYSNTTRYLVEYLSTWASLAGGNTQKAA